MLETDDLLVEPRDGGALWLTFNRPAAREAYDAGLVSHVTPDADFPALVDRIVRRLTQGAPLAQTATKKAVNAATLDQLEAASSASAPGRRSCCARKTSPKACVPSTSSAAPTSAGRDLAPRTASTQGQHHFSARALITVRLRLVATPRYFSTATLVSVAS